MIGAGSVICCQAIVFAGARLGEGVIVGDQAFVRERVTIGERSVVGRGSTVENDTAIGARVKIQTQVYVTAYMTIEDDVFVGPGRDDDQRRHDEPARRRLRAAGPVLRRACRVGGGATLCPGVEIGEEAFIAAGAVVTRDVPARGRRHGRAGAACARWRRRLRLALGAAGLAHWSRCRASAPTAATTSSPARA